MYSYFDIFFLYFIFVVKDPLSIATSLIEELELEQKKNASKVNNTAKNSKSGKNSKKKKPANKQQKNLKSYDDSSESEPEVMTVKPTPKVVETPIKNLDLFNSDDSEDGSEEIKVSPPKLYSRSKNSVRSSSKIDFKSQPNFKESSRTLIPSLDSFPTLSAALTSNKNSNQHETKNMFRIVSTTIESNPTPKTHISKSHSNFNKMSVPTKTSVQASKTKVEANINATECVESKTISIPSPPKINSSLPATEIIVADMPRVESTATSLINSLPQSIIPNMTQTVGNHNIGPTTINNFDSTSFSAPATPCKNIMPDNLLHSLSSNFNSSSLPSSPLKSLVENQSVLNLSAAKRLNFSTNAPVFIPSMPFNSNLLNMSGWNGDSPNLKSFPPTISINSISSIISNNVHPVSNWNGQLLPQTNTNASATTTSASTLKLGLNFNGPSIW